jgi:serine/threonine protein kinase
METSHYEEGRAVAIKSVKHTTLKEKQNFMWEMCIMSKMLHPNIVRLYGLVLKGNVVEPA